MSSDSQQENPPQQQVLYADIKAEDEPTTMTSFCVNCQQQGKTTILLTKIPMFKEMILISFECEHCGYKNNQVQFGGKLNAHAINIELQVESVLDLQRDVIRSEHCVIKIPELNFEAPPNKKGTANTIQGFLVNFVDDLSEQQEERFRVDAVTAQKIQGIIDQLQKYSEGLEYPFTFLMEDASGNSFIKNPYAPNPDSGVKMTQISRTREHLIDMGFSPQNAELEVDDLKQKNEIEEKAVEEIKKVEKSQKRFDAHKIDFTKPFNQDDTKGESLVFKVNCHSCSALGETKMCTTSIPYFQEIIVMSFSCDYCGVRSTEVKVGGEITAKACQIELKVDDQADLQRDLFKSETARVILPDIDFQIDYGTLGGVYTTVEGLIEKISDNLKDNNPFSDSSATDIKEKMDILFQNLEDFKSGQRKFLLIIQDVVDNSFIQNPFYPKQDHKCVKTLFERTKEQNDYLGLDFMKVDNY